MCMSVCVCIMYVCMYWRADIAKLVGAEVPLLLDCSSSSSSQFTAVFSILCARYSNFFPAKRLSRLTCTIFLSRPIPNHHDHSCRFVSNCHALSHSHLNRTYTTLIVDKAAFNNHQISEHAQQRTAFQRVIGVAFVCPVDHVFSWATVWIICGVCHPQETHTLFSKSSHRWLFNCL